jgi:signal transduction histidine kinase
MVDQGSGIVRALLGFVRPREGDERPLELNAFVHETVKLVADQASPVIRFHFEPDPALPRTRARVDLLRQVLMNLLFNAADAITGPGEVRLSTRALDRLPSGLVLPPSPAPRYARIDVGDTGHGIDPEILPRIFEPFFTTKAMSTRRGTGLGLTMVYEIAKDNGYGLAVESVPGEGATFRVFLPLTDPDPAIAQPPG